MKNGKTVFVILDDNLHKQLKNYTKERGMTIQGFVSVLVKRELANAEKESE